MKRGCLLWLLGVPLPVVLILYFLFFRLAERLANGSSRRLARFRQFLEQHVALQARKVVEE
jgi:hypothetical protein